MATFQAQVQSLTSLTISSSGTTPDEAELTEFLTQGAKDVINRTIAANPDTKMEFSTTTEDDNNEGIAINGDIINVVREHDSTSVLRPCTKINPNDRYEATDTESLSYRSKYNPGWYKLNGKVFIVPVSAGSNNSSLVTQITYPTVPYGDTNWSYPAKYETLIAYYASMMSLMAKAGSLQADSDVTTALTAVKTEAGLAKAEIVLAIAEVVELTTYTDNNSDYSAAIEDLNTAAGKFRASGDDPGVFGNEDVYTSQDSRLTLVADALSKVQNLVDGTTMGGDTESESAQFWLNEEDPEMVEATLKVAGSELKRAEALITEWDIVVKTLTAEVGAFSKETEARATFVDAKIKTIKSRIDTAQGYIQTADGYGKEAAIRMQNLEQEYTWYMTRYTAIKGKYDEAFMTEEQVTKRQQTLSQTEKPTRRSRSRR